MKSYWGLLEPVKPVIKAEKLWYGSSSNKRLQTMLFLVYIFLLSLEGHTLSIERKDQVDSYN